MTLYKLFFRLNGFLSVINRSDYNNNIIRVTFRLSRGRDIAGVFRPTKQRRFRLSRTRTAWISFGFGFRVKYNVPGKRRQ